MDKARDDEAWPDEVLIARCLAEADEEGYIDFKVFGCIGLCAGRFLP